MTSAKSMSNSEDGFKGTKPERKIFPPKTCISCGEEFKRTLDMQATTWRTKKTCSRECLNVSRNNAAIKRNEAKHGAGCLDDKPCQVCGVIMTKADSFGNYVFIRKRTCSNECAGVLRKETYTVHAKKQTAPTKTLEWYWEQHTPLQKLIHSAITRPLLRKK